ncbi:MAG: M23 family metallopeptidase [Spirochaetes bacterium]|nr:M23 family metallopeptidase [Spirochaetota bacterium]
MIAPLQRQHVRRRQRISLRLRARPRHARPSRSPQAPAPQLVRRALPRLPVPRRARRGAVSRLLAAAARPLRRRSGIRRPGAATERATRLQPRRVNGWQKPAPAALRPALLFAATLALLSAVILLGTGTLRFPGQASRVEFPDSEAAALEMMHLVVPEEPAAAPDDLPGPKTLKTLSTTVYTVRQGDSVSGIAQKHGLSIDTVLSWNAIRDAHLVVPGRVLTLPNADGLRYTVRRGDTLESIAKRSGIPLASILDWNDLGSSVITVNQALFLPGARMPAADIARALGTLFVWPVKGRLSSRYGIRVGPVDGIQRMHWGIDLEASTGTSVLAAAAGTVADVGYNGTYGKYIILRHSGFQTLYGHLSRFTVAVGESVAQGRKIGEVGNTGVSTGPHLHFGVFRGGEPVDPLRYLK